MLQDGKYLRKPPVEMKMQKDVGEFSYDELLDSYQIRKFFFFKKAIIGILIRYVNCNLHDRRNSCQREDLLHQQVHKQHWTQWYRRGWSLS